MNVIGLETSGLAGSIALVIDGQVRERSLATAGRRHAQTLLAEWQALLVEHQLTPAAVHVVGVSIGPGSFTGLRVGVVAAKTWGYARQCPIVAVDTLAATLEPAPQSLSSAWVIADAQRGDLFARPYRREEHDWVPTAELMLVAGETFWSQRQPGEVVVGSGVKRSRPETTVATIPREPWAEGPTAAAIAAIAARHWQRGLSADIWRLTPVYVRPSAAEEKAVAQRPPTR